MESQEDEQIVSITLGPGAQGEQAPDVDVNAVYNKMMTEEFPASMMYYGTPIDPMCFAQMGNSEEVQEIIQLDQCDNGAFVVEEYFFDKPYSRGAAYRDADDEEPMGIARPYVMYEIVPPQDMSSDEVLIQITWSGGGTGQFSSLFKMKRDGDTLRVIRPYGGGDRCNNGVHHYKIDESGAVVYGLNATPYDLVAMGGDPERAVMQSLPAYDVLDACAACCYGTLNYNEGRFYGVSLSENLAETLASRNYSAEAQEEQSKQLCLDKMLGDLLASSPQRDFADHEWAAFIAEFEADCLKD